MIEALPVILMFLPPIVVWVLFYRWAFIQAKKNQGVPMGASMLRMFAARNFISAIFLLIALIAGWVWLINLFMD